MSSARSCPSAASWASATATIRCQGGYVVDLDKDRLEGAPQYVESESPDWADPSYGCRIDDFYGPFPGL